jgi:hypothetical protein
MVETNVHIYSEEPKCWRDRANIGSIEKRNHVRISKSWKYTKGGERCDM